MKKRLIIAILLAFFIISVFAPITVLLLEGTNIGTLEPSFIAKLKEGLSNSIIIAIAVTIISVMMAFNVASLIIKYHHKRKNLILMFLTFPMLVPTFTHAIGFVSLLGNNGLFNNIFNANINIYGFWGIVLCSVCYGFPTALIMFVDLLSSENRVPYQVATTLGIPKFSQFIKIKLSFIAKPTLFIIFTVFTIAITDYGIPMMIGGQTRTLTTLLYEQIVGRLNFGNGALISVILLLPAIVIFIIELMTRNHGKCKYQLEDDSSLSKPFRMIAVFVYIIVFVLISFPMISCLFISFSKKFPLDLSFSLVHIKRIFQGEFLGYLKNSLIIAFFTTLVGLLITFAMAYITARVTNKRMAKALHLFAIFTSSVPGLVLAVAYMLAFNKSMIYGTIIILIMANIVRFMGTPYLIFYNKLEKIDKTVESSGSTLGISRIYLIKDVIVPQSLPAITEGFCYIFVNTMTTVTTVLFLATPFTKPLALSIVQLEAHGFIEMASSVSLIILITNILLKALVFYLSKVKPQSIGNMNREKIYE